MIVVYAVIVLIGATLCGMNFPEYADNCIYAAAVLLLAGLAVTVFRDEPDPKSNDHIADVGKFNQ